MTFSFLQSTNLLQLENMMATVQQLCTKSEALYDSYLGIQFWESKVTPWKKQGLQNDFHFLFN